MSHEHGLADPASPKRCRYTGECRSEALLWPAQYRVRRVLLITTERRVFEPTFPGGFARDHDRRRSALIGRSLLDGYRPLSPAGLSVDLLSDDVRMPRMPSCLGD